VEDVFSEGEPLGLPWQTVAAFLRVVTNPKLRGVRFTVEEAAAIVDQWVAQPNVRLLAPGDQHWTVLRPALVNGQVRGPLITDAQLAALTEEYGGVLHTTDRDFARFPQLRWKNPFESE
jgi:toxin-antitoxin system PIN domain toxin